MKVSAIERSSSFKNNNGHGAYYETSGRESRIIRKNMMQRRRRTVVFGSVLSAAMLSIILVSSLSFSSNAGGDHAMYKCYTSVEIHPGETLWTIANDYTEAGYYDRITYIDEIKSVNHLLGDEIRAGDYLVLPYYTALDR